MTINDKIFIYDLKIGLGILVRFNGIIVKENGISFFFKYDTFSTDQLHIYVRHLATIDNALDVFFEANNTWNPEYERFESKNDTHELYWFWLDDNKTKVMIITCFNIYKDKL